VFRWRDKLLASASKLGPLETELLRVLWTRGDSTVRELLAAGHQKSAYTTIMTTLDRLHKKGLLNRVPDGRAYRYSPRYPEAEYNRRLLASAISALIGSSSGADVPLSFLVEAVTEHDVALLPALERAVERKRRELKERRKR